MFCDFTAGARHVLVSPKTSAHCASVPTEILVDDDVYLDGGPYGDGDGDENGDLETAKISPAFLRCTFLFRQA